MTDMTPINRKAKTTPERVVEYVQAMEAAGIPVSRATIEGRKIILDLKNGDQKTLNPADLVTP